MVMKDPMRFYLLRQSQLQGRRERLLRSDRLFVLAKLMTVLALPVVFLVDGLKNPFSMTLIPVLLVAEFFLHDPILRGLRILRAHLALIRYEIGSLLGEHPLMPPLPVKECPDHPYDTDLNISGEQGLFTFLSRCHTLSGQYTLHRWLLEPALVAERKRRLDTIDELRQNTGFRHAFLAISHLTQDRERRKNLKVDLQAVPTHAIVPAWVRILPGLTILLIGMTFLWGRWWPVFLTFLIQMIVNFATGLKQKQVIDRCRGIWKEMQAHRQMLVLIESAVFVTPLLREGQSRINSEGVKASRAISRLERLLQCLELRGSTIHPLINNLFLWDLTLIARLVHWRKLFGERLETWISLCGECEALCSVASVSFNHPGWTRPEYTDIPLQIKADNLGHPLMNAQRQVTNDFSIPGPHHLFFITGPNMAGKSTFIRAVATAIVMAQAGFMVFARSFSLGPMAIITSLNHTDSLSEGKSLFHKELDRLSMVWEYCHRADVPVLFFLDEMLRGTNPIDRHNGSCWVLKLLVRQSASGLVATHDLGLTTLADEENGQLTLQNNHFSCEITHDRCLFDYRLHEGTAPSVNALPLMRQRGFPIP